MIQVKKAECKQFSTTVYLGCSPVNTRGHAYIDTYVQCYMCQYEANTLDSLQAMLYLLLSVKSSHNKKCHVFVFIGKRLLFAVAGRHTYGMRPFCCSMFCFS